MEESYWFLRFSVFFTADSNEKTDEIKGNAVFVLKSKSFLPATVIDSLKNFYKKELSKKRKVVAEIEVYLDFVLQIDQAGVTNFSMIGLTSGDSIVTRSEIVSRHYSLETRVARSYQLAK